MIENDPDDGSRLPYTVKVAPGCSAICEPGKARLDLIQMSLAQAMLIREGEALLGGRADFRCRAPDSTNYLLKCGMEALVFLEFNSGPLSIKASYTPPQSN